MQGSDTFYVALMVSVSTHLIFQSFSAEWCCLGLTGLLFCNSVLQAGKGLFHILGLDILLSPDKWMIVSFLRSSPTVGDLRLDFSGGLALCHLLY